MLAMYLVFFGGGWAGLYRADLRLASVSLAGLVGLGWALVAWRAPEWRPRSLLLPAILIALGSLAISTATSRFPRQSVEYLGYAVILAVLYLLLVRILANPFFRARVGALAVALAVVIGVAYAAANLVRWIDWWGVVGRITLPPLRPESESLTFGNPSTILTIILLFAFSAVAVVGFSSAARRIVIAIIGALTAFAILVSGSRAGWLALGIATLVLFVLLAADPARRQTARDLLTRWMSSARTRVALAVATVGGLGAITILAPVIIRRATEGGEDLRLNFLLAAGRMFREAPIFGTGPGTWVIQRIRYTIAPETDYYIPHAHNLYAQTAAELGIVGILAGLVLVACLVALIRDAIGDADPARRRWGWAAAIVMTYFAAHQLLDFYANMSAILFAAALPIAWLDATATQPLRLRARDLPDRFGRASTVLGMGAFAAACILLVASELPALGEERAVALANDGRWAEADVSARDVVGSDPSWATYQMTMGLTAANVGDHERAAAAFRRVAESDDLPEAWLDLAAEEAILGHSDALDALGRAARLGLQRPALAMGIGDLAARLGDMTLSDSAFVAAVGEVPSLAGDPWWQADPVRAAQLARVVDVVIATYPASRQWEVALMAGEVARARSLLPAASDVAGTVTPDDVVAAWTGDAAALQRIEAICDAHPLDLTALAWAARIEDRRGNMDAGDRYRRWAFTASSGAGEAGSELRVSDTQMLGRSAQGGVAEFWGAYTYRRFTPWNLLAPSVIQLTLE